MEMEACRCSALGILAAEVVLRWSCDHRCLGTGEARGVHESHFYCPGRITGLSTGPESDQWVAMRQKAEVVGLGLQEGLSSNAVAQRLGLFSGSLARWLRQAWIGEGCFRSPRRSQSGLVNRLERDLDESTATDQVCPFGCRCPGFCCRGCDLQQD